MIYAYYNDLQEQEYLSCCEHREMLGFTQIHRFIEQIHSDDILVLFSQPSDEESNLLRRAEWFCALVLDGIRFEASAHRPVHRFTCQSFTARLDDVERVRLQQRRREYLLHHADASTEERSYLARLSGVDMASASPAGNRAASVSLEDSPLPGGLFVVLGDDDDFMYFVQKCRARRCLLIDGDLLRPSFDVLFSVRHIGTSMRTQLVGNNNTGLNVLLDALSKDVFHPDLFRRVVKRWKKHCDLLLGNYNLYNYEYYSDESLLRLLEAARSAYETVMLRAQTFPYDRFALTGLHAADRIVILLPEDRASIRYWHQLYRIYTEKQGISADRIVVLSRSLTAPHLVLQQLFGKSYLSIGRRRAAWRV